MGEGRGKGEVGERRGGCKANLVCNANLVCRTAMPRPALHSLLLTLALDLALGALPLPLSAHLSNLGALCCLAAVLAALAVAALAAIRMVLRGD